MSRIVALSGFGEAESITDRIGPTGMMVALGAAGALLGYVIKPKFVPTAAGAGIGIGLAWYMGKKQAGPSFDIPAALTPPTLPASTSALLPSGPSAPSQVVPRAPSQVVPSAPATPIAPSVPVTPSIPSSDQVQTISAPSALLPPAFDPTKVSFIEKAPDTVVPMAPKIVVPTIASSLPTIQRTTFATNLDLPGTVQKSDISTNSVAQKLVTFTDSFTDSAVEKAALETPKYIPSIPTVQKTLLPMTSTMQTIEASSLPTVQKMPIMSSSDVQRLVAPTTSTVQKTLVPLTSTIQNLLTPPAPTVQKTALISSSDVQRIVAPTTSTMPTTSLLPKTVAFTAPTAPTTAMPMTSLLPKLISPTTTTTALKMSSFSLPPKVEQVRGWSR